MALGHVLAVLATLASGSGSILESMDIRRAGVYGGTSFDLAALRRQWIYFLGLGVDLPGLACAAAAPHRLPLFLVQSMLAYGPEQGANGRVEFSHDAFCPEALLRTKRTPVRTNLRYLMFQKSTHTIQNSRTGANARVL